MKILLMDWPAFGIKAVKRILPELGHEIEVFDFPYDSADAKYGEKLCVEIVNRVLRSGADLIFSFNFFPVIATAAHACRKKYVSWIYDSPAILLYSMAVFFPENYIFHFDSSEAERMKREGVEHVFYFPLAADIDEYDKKIPDDIQKNKYDADISMIGSMYREDKYQIFKKYEIRDEYIKGYLDGLINTQEQLYGVDILESGLTEDIMQRIMKYVPLPESCGDSYETPQWVYANYYLAKQVTTKERERILSAMAGNYKVALYTPGKTPYMPEVINRGSVDYCDEAPYAIKCAKINLNISLRSIHTGIPQRALDIMGCGGFLMSNYQEDLCRDFIDGEEFICYESLDDAVEKAGYYLEHDKERLEIASRGYEKIRHYYGYADRLQELMSIVLEGEI